MFLARFAAGLVFMLAWVLPNHSPPWMSFWQDWLAGLGLVLLLGWGLSGVNSSVLIPRAAFVIALVAAIPLVQWLFGQIFFFGDGFIAAFYLMGLALAVVTPSLARERAYEIVEPMLWALLWAAVVSVALALCQLFNVEGLTIFLVDLPLGGRPYANLAQPNQLATLMMLGIVVALWQFQRQRLGKGAVCLTVLWLMLGVVMTQSRAAWLAMGVLIAWLWCARSSSLVCVPRGAALAMGLVFVALATLWSTVLNELHLTAHRNLGDMMTAGVRLPYWQAMLDAVGREPWWGYGWNQASVAQVRVADAHAPIGQYFDDAHNLVLEWLLSGGVPMGMVVAACALGWLWRRLTKCRDAQVAFALSGVLVVVAHALVEFPLDYAYFLLPVGLLVGYVETQSPTRMHRVPRAVVIALSIFGVTLLLRAAYEYIDVEQRYRSMRFEMAGFGPAADEEAVPVHLLTQLDTLQKFARTMARRDMSAIEIERMRMTAERYAHPPVLFRYALAAGLNGDPETAGRTLKVLCHMHVSERCAEGMRAWQAMSNGDFPELKRIAFPNTAVGALPAAQLPRISATEP